MFVVDTLCRKLYNKLSTCVEYIYTEIIDGMRDEIINKIDTGYFGSRLLLVGQETLHL